MSDQTVMHIVGPNGEKSAPFTGDDLKKAAEAAKDGPPLKPDPEFDQARDNAYRVTADELRQFIERYERLEADKKELADQQKEVMAEAKGRGYSVRALKALVKLRAQDPDQRAEDEAVLDMYREAVGLN